MICIACISTIVIVRNFQIFSHISVHSMSSFFSETADPIPIKFSQYLCLADLSGICSNQFDHSSMTSSTRHFVFWPSKPIINDIFNTKHHKSIKLGTHKLHVIIYQIMSHDLTCASLRTHTRASKFKNAPIDLKIFLDTFQTISSISKISARACPCARFPRAQHVRKLNFSF